DMVGSSKVWLVSNESVLCNRIEMAIRTVSDQISRVRKEELESEGFWTPLPRTPDLIILDVESDVDWGMSAIRRLKRARMKAPLVVITATFSREFGEKILTEGVRYYFAHDFSTSEFREVVESLIKLKQRQSA